jgi:hypothetical protein
LQGHQQHNGNKQQQECHAGNQQHKHNIGNSRDDISRDNRNIRGINSRRYSRDFLKAGMPTRARPPAKTAGLEAAETTGTSSAYTAEGTPATAVMPATVGTSATISLTVGMPARTGTAATAGTQAAVPATAGMP